MFSTQYKAARTKAQIKYLMKQAVIHSKQASLLNGVRDYVSNTANSAAIQPFYNALVAKLPPAQQQ